jgi:hypothetical protein
MYISSFLFIKGLSHAVWGTARLECRLELTSTPENKSFTVYGTRLELHLPQSNTGDDAGVLLLGRGGVVGNVLSGVGGIAGIPFSDTCDVVAICGITGVTSSVWVTTLNLPRFTGVVVIGLLLVSEFQEA